MRLEERICRRFGVREIKLLNYDWLNYSGKIRLQDGGGTKIPRKNSETDNKKLKSNSTTPPPALWQFEVHTFLKTEQSGHPLPVHNDKIIPFV